jgi:hypothetical protein
MPNGKQPTRKVRKTVGADEGKINVPIVRQLPPDLVMHFVDSTIVTHTENEFILSFLQTQHPLAASKEEVQKVTQVVSECVARIVVTPRHMEQIVSALQTNLEK